MRMMTMATGIPKTKWTGNGLASPRGEGLSRGLDMVLTYEGKRTEEEILSTVPAEVSIVWPTAQARQNATKNRLYYGDNLPILAALLRDGNVRGQVRLVYIDPPFATRSVFQSRSQTDAYADLLAGAHYVEFLRERLILLRELMAADGSIYVHLDENMAFYLKVIMDEVFGPAHYRNWITRKKCNPKNYTRKTFGNVSDYILFYTKSDHYVWHRPFEEWTEERAAKEYSYLEEGTGRRYKKVPLHAPGVRHGETGKPWRGLEPPPGKHWQFPPQVLDEMDARGEIYWSPNGNPRRKIYLDDSEGVPVQDLWLEFRDAHNQNIRITGYPTEKNPELLARIIEASSNPGDLVLDCFSGSGTTLAVASGLGRAWIGIDNSVEAIATTLKRFARGTEPMGDFVNQRLATQGRAGMMCSDSVPSLFDSFDLAPTEPLRPVTHTPTTDFGLWANPEQAGDLRECVEEWTRRFPSV
jgi:adenine-specific DNA-methyltransferase